MATFGGIHITGENNDTRSGEVTDGDLVMTTDKNGK